ncbi:hypothetical protein P9112_008284 [Eukaryota sp. TZLM1-RC]
MSQLANLLQQTLNPQTQAEAAKQLQDSSRQTGFTRHLLDFIASFKSQDVTIIQAASILFKNNIRKYYPDDQSTAISDDDRTYIKQHIVTLMLQVPELIRSQLSEAVVTIAETDYPTNWPTLRDELVSKFTSQTDFIGALATFEAIFRKYSSAALSDELIREMLHVLEPYSVFCTPFLSLFTNLIKAFTTSPMDKMIQQGILYSLDIIMHLTTPDLPAFFEDNFASQEQNILSMFRTLLGSPEDDPHAERDDPPSNNWKIKEKVCDLIRIYGSKYESNFEPFIDLFLQDVFSLISGLSDAPRFDGISISATLFLDAIARSNKKQKFNSRPILEAVVNQVALPLLTYRDEDLETTLEDPRQFVITELDTGLVGETSSRRGAATELVRGLTSEFRADMINICQTRVTELLASSSWSSQVSAVLLALAVGIRAETPQKGATELVQGVNLISLFESFIIPALNKGENTIVICTCIRFITVLRGFLPEASLSSVTPTIVNSISHDAFIVHSFASWCLDKLLNTSIGPKLLTSEAVGQLLGILFAAFNKKFSELNEFVMKTVVSVITNSSSQVLFPHAQTVVSSLIQFFEKIVKNPTNPSFNYFVFEGIAAVINVLTTEDQSGKVLEAFEAALFYPFSVVLVKDIQDFEPFVFQILAFLLEKGTGPWSDNYVDLLRKYLLNIQFWEIRGNVPSLSRLVAAYVRRGKTEISRLNLVEPLLGPWQKLAASRQNDRYSFGFLMSLFNYVPLEGFSKFLPGILSVLLTRYTKSQTITLRRGFYEALSLFINKFGGDALLQQFEHLQSGLTETFFNSYWIPECSSSWRGLNILKAADRKKLVMVGNINLLKSTFIINKPHLFLELLSVIINLSVNDSSESSITINQTLTQEEDSNGYSPQHTTLKNATPPKEEWFEVPDPIGYFNSVFTEVVKSSPNISTMLKSQEHAQLVNSIAQFVGQSGQRLNI